MLLVDLERGEVIGRWLGLDLMTLTEALFLFSLEAFKVENTTP